MTLNCQLSSINLTNETLLYIHILITSDFTVFFHFNFFIFIHYTHVRLSYVLNSYLLTYLLM